MNSYQHVVLRENSAYNRCRTSAIAEFHATSRASTQDISAAIGNLEAETIKKDGGRYWTRTSDPYRVKVML